ncbi:MAG: D-alanyl-D-alanine carboxypeptidase [Saprospiraceae bacterium]|nr:D-alanyl-D-alanine carboxypeptidase [Saprospiraceae bacterium]
MMATLRIPLITLLASLFLLFACSPARQIQREVKKSPVFNRAFTGFTLLDPETGRTLADVNGDHYFTPASCIKILTLYTCLKVLGDSVPGLKYQTVLQDSHSTIVLKATADPTFLHPRFQAWQAPFQFLKNRRDSILLYPQPEMDRFGPGWAWDDYPYGFQPERSTFPMYGNVVHFLKNEDVLEIQPPFFKNDFVELPYYLAPAEMKRKEFENQWLVPLIDLKIKERWLPFTAVNPALLLSDTLGKPVREAGLYEFENGPKAWQTLYSTPLDTVMRRMMHQSDNFIAEQMLLLCAGKKFNTLDQDTLIQWVLDSVLTELPQRPKWIDGSGLSRYNLMTPQSIATVLLRLWREQPQEALLSLFPAGGVDGTLSEWYAGKDGKPYVFAKTGSMGSVSCLSGYVRTRRGKMLIFSFMHNHFVGSSREWKEEMQRILERL